MATRLFGSLANGHAYAFNPAVDILRFAATTYHAAKVVLTPVGSNMNITYGAKTITLNGLSIDEITTTNFRFDDGSRVKVGTSAANSINGTAFDDLIYGQGGNDVLKGGDGDDRLLGGSGDDALAGAVGNDTLEGGTGADAMNGGVGNDTYVLDSTGDAITDSGGVDTVKLTGSTIASYTLTLENLDASGATHAGGLVLKGSTGANVISGSAGDDTVLGKGGADTIAGGAGNDSISASGTANDSFSGGAGNDTLNGGAGNDTLNGGNGNDVLVLDRAGEVASGGGGTDTARITGDGFDYMLTGDVENLDASMASTGGHTYTGSTGNNIMTDGAAGNALDGGDGNDSLAGRGGNDSLIGGAGDDTLDGGLGADDMSGGYGNDTFVVNAAADQVSDLGGDDRVRIVGSGITAYTLDSFMENLDASASPYEDGLALTGNVGDNDITGSDGSDTIAGGGGDDWMHGGYGSDTYHLDSAGDAVDDIGGDFDTVLIFGDAFASYTLASGLEQLDASGSAYGGGMVLVGNAALNWITGSDSDYGDTISGVSGGYYAVFGGEGDDSITGNDGNDTLNGGSGDDILAGGSGNDAYIVDSDGDVIDPDPSGTDRVFIRGSAIASYTLRDDLEELHAGQSRHSAGLTLNGNAGNNAIFGSGYGDSIDGYGGTDLLKGGDGNDTIAASGNSTLDGGAGDDSMAAGGGNNFFNIDSYQDALSDAGGTDTIVISGSAITSYSLGLDFEHLDGSKSSYGGGLDLNGNISNNHITGTAANDTLNGGTVGPNGDDSLEGGGADDSLIGGDGDDTLNGGSGDDILAGGSGNDAYIVDSDGDVIDPDPSGTDRVFIRGSDVASYTLRDDLEELHAGQSRHSAGLTLNGNAGNNAIFGSGYGDSIDGYGGTDLLMGGDGNDTIAASGNSTLDGGTGDDTLLFTGGQSLDFATARNILRIDRIDLSTDASANSITLLDSDVNLMTDAATLYVDGDANDSVLGAATAGLWTRSDPGGDYYQYMLNGATLYIDKDVQTNLSPGLGGEDLI